MGGWKIFSGRAARITSSLWNHPATRLTHPFNSVPVTPAPSPPPPLPPQLSAAELLMSAAGAEKEQHVLQASTEAKMLTVKSHGLWWRQSAEIAVLSERRWRFFSRAGDGRVETPWWKSRSWTNARKCSTLHSCHTDMAADLHDCHEFTSALVFLRWTCEAVPLQWFGQSWHEHRVCL